VPLKPLELHDVFACLPESVANRARKDPKMYQLILSCAGHPRAIVDGFRDEELLKKLPTNDDTKLTARDFTEMQLLIVKTCKFHNRSADNVLTLDIVSDWFNFTFTLTEDDDKKYHEWGLLWDLTDDVTMLSPIMLHHWAYSNRGEYLAEDLRVAYDHDADISEAQSEKNAESVLCRFEAVRRLATKGCAFQLREYYKQAHLNNAPYVTVTCKNPIRGSSNCSAVKQVSSFKGDTTTVLDYLNRGYIVYSNLQNELGIEYVVPFHDEHGVNLVALAGVQVKFVQGRPDESWTDIRTKAVTALKMFSSLSVQTFPVIITTTDQGKVSEGTAGKLDDCVLFLERDTFRWTQQLGVLRLHEIKLGGVIAKEYPFLRKSVGGLELEK